MENLKSVIAKYIDEAKPYAIGFAAGFIVAWIF